MPDPATQMFVDRLTREGLIGMAPAGRLAARCPKTMRRWCVVGEKGVRLECVRVGRTLHTSEPAVRRFLAAIQPAPAARPAPRTPRDKHLRRSLENAARLGLYEPPPKP